MVKRILEKMVMLVSFLAPFAVFADIITHWDPSRDYTGFRYTNGHYPMGWLYKDSAVVDNILLTVILLALASLIFWGVLFIYRVVRKLLDRKRSNRELVFAFLWSGCSAALVACSVVVWCGNNPYPLAVSLDGPPNLAFYDTEGVRNKYDRHCLARYDSFFDNEKKLYKFNAPLPRENAPKEITDAYNKCYDEYCLKYYKRVISPPDLPRFRNDAPENVKEAYDGYCLKFYKEFQDKDSNAGLPMIREEANQKVKEAYDSYCLKFYNRYHRHTRPWFHKNTPVPRAGAEKKIVDEYEVFKIKEQNAKQVSPSQGKYTVFEVGGENL